MARFERIGHLVFAVQNSGGGIFLLFCFHGGLKMPLENQGALFIISVFFQGDFFGSSIVLERSKKNQGGLHTMSENSGGPIFITCPDQKRPP